MKSLRVQLAGPLAVCLFAFPPALHAQIEPQISVDFVWDILEERGGVTDASVAVTQNDSTRQEYDNGLVVDLDETFRLVVEGDGMAATIPNNQGGQEAAIGRYSIVARLSYNRGLVFEEVDIKVLLEATVNTSGQDASSSVLMFYQCLPAWGCQVSDPLVPESGSVGITSDIQNGNFSEINGDIFPTTNFGGLEFISAEYDFNLFDTGGPDDGLEILLLWDNLPVSSEALSEYVLTVQVVPVPAAVWLFASAIGVLGWLKRRAA